MHIGRSTIAAAILALALVVGCSDDRHGGLTPTQQVYEVVFNARAQDALTEVLILSHTEAQYLRGKDSADLRSYIQREVPISDDMLDQLFESSEQSVELDWQPVMINATFIRKADISTEEDWTSRKFAEDFRAAYSRDEQFYAVSDVVFNDDYTKAALVLSYFCPELCGGGEFLLYLERTGMEWKTTAGTFFWIT